MSIFGDMTRPEAASYLRENRDDLVAARDDLIMATQRSYAKYKAHHAFERALTCEEYVQRVLDAAFNPLSEEVREFLVW